MSMVSLLIIFMAFNFTVTRLSRALYKLIKCTATSWFENTFSILVLRSASQTNKTVKRKSFLQLDGVLKDSSALFVQQLNSIYILYIYIYVYLMHV